MQEREAKLLFKSNDLSKIVISRSVDNRGWSIKLIENTGKSHDLVSKRHDYARVFKTSDAALRCCNRIGFSQAEVQI